MPGPTNAVPSEFDRQRELMVERQIRARGVTSARVLEAMASVRREGYVPPSLAAFAYEDRPLSIAAGQTISQPYIVALMLEALSLVGSEKVLEVGTGSGYAAAVLGLLAREVYTIERHAELAVTAAERLVRDGYGNVHVRTGDGTLGWPEQSPFDAIVVAAGSKKIPPALRAQLAVGGRLVIPVGRVPWRQQLIRVTRTTAVDYREESLAAVRFVPLVGVGGWRR